MDKKELSGKYNPAVTYQSTIYFFAIIFTLPYSVYLLVFEFIIPLYMSILVMLSFGISLFLALRHFYSAAVIWGLITLLADIFIFVFFFGISIGVQHYLLVVNVLFSVSVGLKKRWGILITLGMLGLYLFIMFNFTNRNPVYEISEQHKLLFSEANIIISFTVLALSFYRYHQAMDLVKAELHRYHGKVMHMARTDSLTDLPNRRTVEDELDLAMSCSEEENPELGDSEALGEVDNFKMINDNYGHHFGDAVLQELASRFKSLTRADDFIGRWGGEEFIFILRNTTAEQAYNTMERLRIEATSEPVTSDDSSVKITISFGVSHCRGKDTKDSIFQRVDDLLYKAKDSGKDRVIGDPD